MTPSPPCTPCAPSPAPAATSPPPPSAASTRRPATRDPHEETGDLEADALHDSLWSAGRGLRIAATAAYFAEALGRGDRDLPDAPRLDELADHAHDLADSTESEEIRRLAEVIDTANRMM